MFDCNPTAPQRSFGKASVGFGLRGARVALQTLRQQGSAKAILPRVEGSVPEVVFLNTSGGLTSGDRLEYRLDLGDGCRAVATTQTAERCYQCDAGAAVIEVTVEVGAGGRIDWLPQETILFDGADVRRRTTIDLAASASCLVMEAVLLGRAAMGETVRTLAFRDTRRINRAGRPVYVEAVDLGCPALLGCNRPAILGAARAFASLVFLADGAEDAARALRPLLDEPGVEAAISGFDGKCVARFVARDGWPLRRQLLRLLPQLLARPLPRVWQI